MPLSPAPPPSEPSRQVQLGPGTQHATAPLLERKEPAPRGLLEAKVKCLSSPAPNCTMDYVMEDHPLSPASFSPQRLMFLKTDKKDKKEEFVKENQT